MTISVINSYWERESYFQKLLTGPLLTVTNNNYEAIQFRRYAYRIPTGMS